MLMSLPIPNGRQLNRGIADDRLVAREVQRENQWHRLLSVRWKIDQNILFWSVFVRRKVNRDLFANRFASKCVLIGIKDCVVDMLRRLRTAPVNILLKQGEQLAATSLPVARGGYLFPIVEGQSIRKGECANLRLVVVRRCRTLSISGDCQRKKKNC